MADTKISNMTAASTLDGTELVAGVQSGANVKITTLQQKTLSVGAGSVSIASGKTLTGSNTLTLAGTDSTVMTFPSTSATIARTDAANTFTGASTATSWNLVTPVLGTPSSGNLSNCTAYPFSSLTGSASVAQLGSTSYCAALLAFRISNVDFNSANTDNTITITLPTGFTRWKPSQFFISHASASLTSSTLGLFTATGGGGTAVVANQSVAVATASENTNTNTGALGVANNNTISYTATTLYARVGTAQGSAATADVTFIIIPLS